MQPESSTTKSKTRVIFFVGYHHQCHWMNWPTNLNQLLSRVIFNEQSQHNSDWSITFCSLNGIYLLTSFYIRFSVFCHVYLDTCYSCMSFSIRFKKTRLLTGLFPKTQFFLYFSMVFTLFPPYFQVISRIFPGYFLKSHFFLCVSMVSTLFPPYFHLISKLFPKSHSFLCFSMVFTLFPPYFQVISKISLFPVFFHGFHLISTLFAPYFQVISKISLFPVFFHGFHLISTLFPPYFQVISRIFQVIS